MYYWQLAIPAGNGKSLSGYTSVALWFVSMGAAFVFARGSRPLGEVAQRRA